MPDQNARPTDVAPGGGYGQGVPGGYPREGAVGGEVTVFGGVFHRGGVATGDMAWLQALLDTEAGLARALERAGVAPAGSGEAVTKAAVAADFSAAEVADVAQATEVTGNPVPGLAR